jgi:hypothetical protein
VEASPDGKPTAREVKAAVEKVTPISASVGTEFNGGSTE